MAHYVKSTSAIGNQCEYYRAFRALLLALLLAGGVVKAGAEEVVGTILFGPEKIFDSTGYPYAIDTTGNSITDRQMQAFRSHRVDPVFDTLTKYYLKPGVKFIFENKDLKPFGEMAYNRIIAIEINGSIVELTEMFSRDVIRDCLPYLDNKLKREGR